MPGLAGMRRPEGAEGLHPRPLSWQPTKLRRMRGSFITYPQHVGYHFSRFQTVSFQHNLARSYFLGSEGGWPETDENNT